MRVYANVGSRDLFLTGTPIDKLKDSRQATLRELSNEILQDLDGHRAELSFPILEAPLREISSNSGDQFEELVLAVTDQPADAGHFRQADSIHVGEILQQELPRLDLAPAVRLFTIRDKPNRWEPMARLFHDWLSGEPAPIRGESNIVLISGGTPACNFALLYASGVVWGDRCEARFTSEGGTVGGYSFGREVLERDRRQKALTLIEIWDLDGLRYLFPPGTPLEELGDFAHARLMLDIKTAERLSRRFPDLQYGLQNLKHRAMNEVHVAEAFWQAQLFHDRQQWTEMVARLHLIVEALLDWGVRMRIKPTARKMDEVLDEWKRCAFSQTLMAGGSTPPARWSQVRYGDKQKLIADAPDCVPKKRQTKELIDYLEGLRRLRNSSVAAHGFERLTEDDVCRAGGVNAAREILQHVHHLLKEMQVFQDSHGSPWEALKRRMLQELGQMNSG